MSYAPILDHAAFTSADEPLRQVAHAAALVLRTLASGDGTNLARAVALMQSEVHNNKVVASDNLLASLRALPGVCETLANTTMLPERKVLTHLLRQLVQVQGFAKLGGDTDGQGLAVCAAHIRNGGVELFSGLQPVRRTQGSSSSYRLGA